MVTQIAADTSQSDRDLDAERAKRGRRTNAGPHQHRGRLDGACRHDHAARADENALAIPKDANTLSALTIHDEAFDTGIGPDREIAAPARRLIQIGRGA